MKKVINVFILCVTFINVFACELFCSSITDVTPVINMAKDYKKDAEAAKSKWIGREIYVKESVRELGVWDKDKEKFGIHEGDAYGAFWGAMPMLYKNGYICSFVFDGTPDKALEMDYYDHVGIKGSVSGMFVTEKNEFCVVLIHSKVIYNLAKD